MASKNYVVINGRAYNTITGMVMDDIKIEKSEIEKEQSISRRGTSVSNIHAAHVQKSSTLNRRHVKMPQRTPLAAKPQKARVDVKQHVAVKKFSTPIEMCIRDSRYIDSPDECGKKTMRKFSI